MSQTKEPKEKDAKGTKPRVFNVASELSLDTKAVIELCKELGFANIKNQLNALEPEQVEAIKQRAKSGPPKPAAKPPVAAKPAAPAAPKAAALPKIDAKMANLNRPKPATVAVKPANELPAPAPEPVAPPPVVERPQPVVELPPVPTPVQEPVALPAVVAEMPARVAPPPAPEPVPALVVEPPAAVVTPPVEPVSPSVEAAPKPQVLPPRPPVLGGTRPQTLPPRPPVAPLRPLQPMQPSAAGQPPSRPNYAPSQPGASRPLGGGQPQSGGGPRPPAPNPGAPRSPYGPPQPGAPRPINGPGGMPAGPSRYGPPPSGAQRAGGLPPRQPSGPGMGMGPMRTGGPAPMGGAGGPPRPNQVKLTPEQIQRMRQLESKKGEKIQIGDIQRAMQQAPPPPPPGGPAGPAPVVGRPGFRPPTRDEEEEKKKGPGGPSSGGPGAVAGRDARQKARSVSGRGAGAPIGRGAVVISGGQVDLIEQAAGSRRGPRAALMRKFQRRQQSQKTVITGPVEVTLPLTVRSLSEAIGMKAGELLLKLKNLTNSLYTINSALEFEVAELIAGDKGVELKAKKQETVEDALLVELEKRAEASDPENMVTRPPVVTIMGHVDHGKTSLLDKIRQTYGLVSDVVSTEAGGITQVIRAWRVQKDDKSTTFLDTPGHEAFTMMRARGAKVTDIVVIVVSAADGVMPQTEEAVAHAKAADVDIIVAINKVDLPDANIDKTRRQLYNLSLLPDNMGGDVPFVECSAKTGQGIDELLDTIALMAEVAEYKADPTLAASGTCLEAYLEGDRGVQATVIVQNGTLRKGDIILCGSTYGRIRSMTDDLGRPVTEAGPSVPVKVTGLGDVPDADDPFLVADDIGTAREIADRRAEERQESAQNKFSPVSLDSLKAASTKIKISELKLILKAEARGSVEAIKKEMEKLVHEEVRVRVLHAGIGAITESDVILALTSPNDTMIVGFNVTVDDAAMKLSEQRSIPVREYDIIYKLTDDVKAALEGKLKPVEVVVHLGRAVIRETFKISKVGAIAGCYVTSGTIERSARVRVIREGTVIYPSGEKNGTLDNLKRFKDDAKEVREGFECGMKVAGFDDVKVGDVIEAFRIDIERRTL